MPDALAAEIAALVADQPGAGRTTSCIAGEPRARARPRRGLAACEHEIVARMDADDVSVPDRFEKQLPVIEAGADIVGCGLLEFGTSVEDVVGRRTPPTDPDEIRRVIRFRDPFNHPTVVYRRSAVQAAGGYTDMALMEDYLLFARMVDGRRAAGQPGRAAGLLPGRRRRLRPRGGPPLLRSELAAAAPVPAARHHHARAVPPQRRGPRRLPARAGGVRKVAYRAPDRQPRARGRDRVDAARMRAPGRGR